MPEANGLTVREKNLTKWNKTEKCLPVPDHGETEIACLAIKKRSLNYIEILVFNDYHKCWDGADGDDVDCEIEDVDSWAYLPELPERSETC